ncbi:unnamed protein product, partial [Iphiclides podalirius]
MSKIYNEGGVRAGCIYRIALENFVTFKQVELYPSQSLNLIIGPNGTGKSTFVCAIILGLCGKTSVIGRAKKISEFVRTGCEQATIEIELYQERGKQNVIITRNFNLKDVSTWYIDKKTVREKQVQELIASLNIQVDNLCQLLPQDRVQDFAKMDPPELLRSTLQAVGGQESAAQLDELIESRNRQKGLSTKLQNNAQVLQEQIRLNERLKVVIDGMNERKEIENKILLCKKKKMWIEYQDLREKVIEYTNDRKEALKLVNSHKGKMEPLERVIQSAKNNISKLEQEKLSANREIHVLKDNVKKTLNAARQQEYQLKDLETSLQEKMDRNANRERELIEARAKLEKLITDKSRLVETVGDETQVKMELAELHKPIAKINAAIETLKKQKLQIQYDLENNIMPQIRLYQNKVRNLENIDVERLNNLRAYSEDCYKAVMWLRENKNMFQHPVYEPMVLEINFTDPKYARYLEATVPARDLVAFTFECSQDMNLFLRKVRLEGGLKRVNAICSAGRFNAQRTDIGQLSYLGFYTYVLDTITGPEPILNYLCKQYSIHKIPIGNDHTYNNSGKVPANITYFFTANHRFTVRVSAYSGAKSSSTIEINEARLLANTMDVEQINNFNSQLSSFNQTAQAHKAKSQELDGKVSALEANLNELNVKRKKINDGVEKVRTIAAQIRLQKKKVQDIENEPALNIEQEKNACKRRQRDCVAGLCKYHHDLRVTMKRLQEKVLNMDLWKVKLDSSRNAIVQQEAQLRELKNEHKNVQATLENIENSLTRAKSDAKEKLNEAKRSCDNKLPQDPGFPHKEDFDALPNDIISLTEHTYELQSRIDCMETGDERVIKEYEEREQLIARLKSDVNNSSDMNKQLETRMNELKSKWLPPLETLLRNINSRFGEMFAKLGCAGEIQLDKSGGDEEFSQYGVAVMVRFRAGEQLQRLTRHLQSGGERALATALYLMALQALAAAPFRWALMPSTSFTVPPSHSFAWQPPRSSLPYALSLTPYPLASTPSALSLLRLSALTLLSSLRPIPYPIPPRLYTFRTVTPTPLSPHAPLFPTPYPFPPYPLASTPFRTVTPTPLSPHAPLFPTPYPFPPYPLASTPSALSLLRLSAPTLLSSLRPIPFPPYPLASTPSALSLLRLSAPTLFSLPYALSLSPIPPHLYTFRTVTPTPLSPHAPLFRTPYPFPPYPLASPPSALPHAPLFPTPYPFPHTPLASTPSALSLLRLSALTLLSSVRPIPFPIPPRLYTFRTVTPTPLSPHAPLFRTPYPFPPYPLASTPSALSLLRLSAPTLLSSVRPIPFPHTPPRLYTFRTVTPTPLSPHAPLFPTPYPFPPYPPRLYTFRTVTPTPLSPHAPLSSLRPIPFPHTPSPLHLPHCHSYASQPPRSSLPYALSLSPPYPLASTPSALSLLPLSPHAPLFPTPYPFPPYPLASTPSALSLLRLSAPTLLSSLRPIPFPHTPRLYTFRTVTPTPLSPHAPLFRTPYPFPPYPLASTPSALSLLRLSAPTLLSSQRPIPFPHTPRLYTFRTVTPTPLSPHAPLFPTPYPTSPHTPSPLHLPHCHSYASQPPRSSLPYALPLSPTHPSRPLASMPSPLSLLLPPLRLFSFLRSPTSHLPKPPLASTRIAYAPMRYTLTPTFFHSCCYAPSTSSHSLRIPPIPLAPNNSPYHAFPLPLSLPTCVDEINQGMDPINERKMFQLLVKVTTECDTAQYFLLTPKLLPNLEYNPKITVHTIMNGHHIMNYRQWEFEKFLSNARQYRPK